MNIGRNKDVNIIFNKKINFKEFDMVSSRSLLGLYLSQVFLFLGILLVLFDNFNLLDLGNYFGITNWVTISVFSIGLFINFISIPFLYFSSFNNFNKEIDFWDKETFWILPLFFFGTFFMYNSGFYTSLILLSFSFLVIMIIHVNFVLQARRVLIADRERSLARKDQYFMTLKYLSAYYLLVVIFLIVYKPV